VFGAGNDLHVGDNCDKSDGSYTSLGTTYMNDTGLLGRIVFTGERLFTAREMEVFEVTEAK
jgi:hypothetical protein